MNLRLLRIATGTGLLLVGVVACSNNKPPESEEQRAQQQAESLQQQQAQREQMRNSQDPSNTQDPNFQSGQPAGKDKQKDSKPVARRTPNPGAGGTIPVVTVPQVPVVTGVGGRLPLFR